jgi:arylsulfatase A-like enzyme
MIVDDKKNMLLTYALVSFCLFSCATAEKPRPNLVFILVDDQGYYDLGCYGGSEFDTPHIDRMAEEGVRFTDYYAAAPICSPSRAGILTGCYPRRVGLATWVLRADSRKGIHQNELTLPELLQTSGYATACIGKWHLGFQPSFLPKQQGFDYYFGLLHNLDPVETIYFEDTGGVALMRNDQVVKRPVDPAELTEMYTNEAIRFIRKNKQRPFFLYLAHTMAHNPMGVTDDFKGKSRFGLYGDVVQCLDHHVGRLLETLKDLNIADRTLVVYTSDNGRGPGRSPDQPLRGSKLTTLEAGIRVPCIVWGPGLGVKSGQTSSQIVHAMDWYPTFATFAGIEVPSGRIIDGRDIHPLLVEQCQTIPSPTANLSLNAKIPLRRPWNPPQEWAHIVTQDEYHQAFFYHDSLGALSAVRWDKWKLRLNPSAELYDLEQDPSETTPVRNAKLVRKLRGMAIFFQEEMRISTRPAGELTPLH